jgi:hypothetical protein
VKIERALAIAARARFEAGGVASGEVCLAVLIRSYQLTSLEGQGRSYRALWGNIIRAHHM